MKLLGADIREATEIPLLIVVVRIVDAYLLTYLPFSSSNLKEMEYKEYPMVRSAMGNPSV